MMLYSAPQPQTPPTSCRGGPRHAEEHSAYLSSLGPEPNLGFSVEGRKALYELLEKRKGLEPLRA